MSLKSFFFCGSGFVPRLQEGEGGGQQGPQDDQRKVRLKSQRKYIMWFYDLFNKCIRY